MKRIYLLMLLLCACSPEHIGTVPVNPEVMVSESPMLKKSFGKQDFSVQKIDGLWIHQGDIIIPEKDFKTRIYNPGEKAAGIPQESTWPDKTVIYSVNETLEGDRRIIDAIAHWETHTDIRFKRRTTENDYVEFIKGSGCYSYVGKVGGKQVISISDFCSTGSTIHEIGHTVGLWHEQSRADRDEYISILWENIIDGREYNFDSYADNVSWDGQDLTSYLDIGSIMMYSSYSFSKNGLPTIVKKDGNTFSVQRSGLSSEDIKGINKLYSNEYENGQYYTILGLTVLRNWDRWYYKSKRGWREVELRDTNWGQMWFYVF